MNLLEQFTSPPSSDYAILLRIILIISLLIFIPFISILFGGTSLSVYFYSKGKKMNNPVYMRFSKDILDKLTISRNVSYGVGLLPLLAVIFLYVQLLYGAKLISVSLFIISFILYSIGFYFIYKFKNNFYLENIFKTFKEKLPEKSFPEIENNFEEIYITKNLSNARIGLSLLAFATFFFTGGNVIAGNIELWNSVDNVFTLFVNGNIWLNYITFIVTSFSITGVVILYFFFIWQGGITGDDKEYSEFVKRIAGWTALIATMVQPVFLFLCFIFSLQISLSPTVFIITAFLIFAILIICNLLYAVIKNSELKYSPVIIFLVFAVMTFNIIKDQSMFANSAKVHFLSVNKKAEEMINKKAGENLNVAGVNPEEIFNTKCSACHKFDVKLVGPPYQETIPKYNNDVKKLSAFIYNPQKINTAYPPMPNQGLKQKEADAVAQWLISKVSGKK